MSVLARGMKRGMTIEYLKCRADLNFEVEFGVNDAIRAIVTSGILFYSDNESFSSIIYFFINTLHVPLKMIGLTLYSLKQILHFVCKRHIS